MNRKCPICEKELYLCKNNFYEFRKINIKIIKKNVCRDKSQYKKVFDNYCRICRNEISKERQRKIKAGQQHQVRYDAQDIRRDNEIYWVRYMEDNAILFKETFGLLANKHNIKQIAQQLF